MNKHHTVERLARLLHLEVHVVATYDGVLTQLGDTHPGERGALEQLRGDHERHAGDIAQLLNEMGEAAPPYSRDIEALFAPARDTLDAAEGGADILQGVRMVERTSARAYEEARDWGVSVQVHDLLSAIDIDEQRHLADVEALLGELAGARQGR
jgi:rubrerythrin